MTLYGPPQAQPPVPTRARLSGGERTVWAVLLVLVAGVAAAGWFTPTGSDLDEADVERMVNDAIDDEVTPMLQGAETISANMADLEVIVEEIRNDLDDEIDDASAVDNEHDQRIADMEYVIWDCQSVDRFSFIVYNYC